MLQISVQCYYNRYAVIASGFYTRTNPLNTLQSTHTHAQLNPYKHSETAKR